MSKKAPLDHAERWLGKQVKAFNESTSLPGAQKQQLVDWTTGLHRAIQTVDQVIDPSNPPPTGTIHDHLIQLGRSQRKLTDVLLGGDEPKGDEGGSSSSQSQPNEASNQTAAASVGI